MTTGLILESRCDEAAYPDKRGIIYGMDVPKFKLIAAQPGSLDASIFLDPETIPCRAIPAKLFPMTLLVFQSAPAGARVVPANFLGYMHRRRLCRRSFA